MKSKPMSTVSAAILCGASIIIIVRPAQAAGCACPGGSQWLTVGQSTKLDNCGLEILLRKMERGIMLADRYTVYVKSDKIVGNSTVGARHEYVIPENGSVTINVSAGACDSLFIGAHRAPQKSFAELDWSYF